MRVGLFNRGVSVAGGGERYSLALAALLARRAEVDVITSDPVDLGAIGDRLQLRLDDLRLRRIDASDDAASRASADYDLFVNATFMSLPVNRGRRGVLLVYFPNQIFPSQRALAKARVAARLARHLSFPRFEGGFAPPTADGRRLVRRTDGRGRLRIRVPGGASTLELELAAPDGRTPIAIHCSGPGIDATHELPGHRGFRRHRIPLASAGGGDVVIDVDAPSGHHGLPAGVAIRGVRVSGVRNAVYRLLFERLLPSRRYVFETANPPHTVWRGLASYDLICTCSAFSQTWIRTYWGRTSEVLHPPVDVEHLQPGEKRPLILSVGRFFRDGHRKRHDVMIEAARALAPTLSPEWRIVLAGGVGGRLEDRRYFAEISSAAAGLPVDVLGDLPGPALVELYRQAALYWHATGFSESGAIDPVCCEHFGISTVEAMAAGCVPIVYGSGGQAEIVRDGIDGIRWRRVPELVRRTRELIEDPHRRRELSRAAVARAGAFGTSTFEARAAALFDPLLAGLHDARSTSFDARP